MNITTLALPPAFGWVLIVMFASVLVCASLLLLCCAAFKSCQAQAYLLGLNSGTCVCCELVQLQSSMPASSQQKMVREALWIAGTTSTCPLASRAHVSSAPVLPCHR